MVHQLGHHESGGAHEGTEGLTVVHPRTHLGARHRAQVPEPRRRSLGRVLTRQGRTEEDRGWHAGDGRGPELGPDPPVHAGKAGEDIADPTEPKPGLRIRHRVSPRDGGLDRGRAHRGP